MSLSCDVSALFASAPGCFEVKMSVHLLCATCVVWLPLPEEHNAPVPDPSSDISDENSRAHTLPHQDIVTPDN